LLASRSGRFTRREKAACNHQMGGWVGQRQAGYCRQENIFIRFGNRYLVVQ